MSSPKLATVPAWAVSKVVAKVVRMHDETPHTMDRPQFGAALGLFSAFGVGISLMAFDLFWLGAAICYAAAGLTAARYRLALECLCKLRVPNVPIWEAATIMLMVAGEIAAPSYLVFQRYSARSALVEAKNESSNLERYLNGIVSLPKIEDRAEFYFTEPDNKKHKYSIRVIIYFNALYGISFCAFYIPTFLVDAEIIQEIPSTFRDIVTKVQTRNPVMSWELSNEKGISSEQLIVSDRIFVFVERNFSNEMLMNFSKRFAAAKLSVVFVRSGDTMPSTESLP